MPLRLKSTCAPAAVLSRSTAPKSKRLRHPSQVGRRRITTSSLPLHLFSRPRTSYALISSFVLHKSHIASLVKIVRGITHSNTDRNTHETLARNPNKSNRMPPDLLPRGLSGSLQEPLENQPALPESIAATYLSSLPTAE
ncbi:hypothetical protein EJ04DRAFT_164982 [Polyplosphaeria fusca]|uniref:Uncharacterized protein n=1 Tax=Polyplosphaeria fusca TaxID=682080 RepID=A0A9P4RC01_9PLEO|nr:hypothetical protein EJ04DRAFT_164982 [Polyplosphaeria fusca]